ncbi:MAG: imidazole glycerol phosphate synthase subunit HisH [Planctomycetes bacterium]|nr:imidazole glycerol phosphate synthase subunit HisH [Planctomycetota bacterium]
MIASPCANLFSVARALRAVGAEPQWVREPRDLDEHSHLVLPGVGAFDAGVAALGAELMDGVRRYAASGRQLLGICLGMQLLFERSAEGARIGLGLLPGEILRLPEDAAHKVPHIGWNELVLERARLASAGAEELWRDVADGAHVYFVHSFAYLDVAAPWVVARAEHGVPFAAAVSRGNVHGAQFHPEKSSRVGLSLLARFLALRPLAASC